MATKDPDAVGGHVFEFTADVEWECPDCGEMNAKLAETSFGSRASVLCQRCGAKMAVDAFVIPLDPDH